MQNEKLPTTVENQTKCNSLKRKGNVLCKDRCIFLPKCRSFSLVSLPILDGIVFSSLLLSMTKT